MRPASQLIEQGIKAYTRGLLDEAERCWTEAMALEPLNDRARAYLDLLAGARPPPSTVPAEPAAIPVPPEVVALPTPDPGETRSVETRSAGTRSAEARPAEARPAEARPAEARPAEARESGKRTTLTEYAPSPWDQGPAEAPTIVLEGGGGLDLATIDEQSDLKSLVPDQGRPPPTPPPLKPLSDVDVWMEGAKGLHALGDFSGSLEMIEKILKVNPGHGEARGYLEENESTLIAMYESKLGAMASIPRLAIKPEEVLWLNLDHRAGFLLAQIDGSVNYEDLFALSGLPRLDTVRILATLLAEGVITS